MRKALLCVAVMILGSGPFPVHAASYAFRNDLSACVGVEPGGTRTQGNLVLAQTMVRLHKPIGECGCLSALAAYAASVDRGGARQILQEGLVGLSGGGPKTFVLATEPALAASASGGITIRLGCAGPL
jgi:hypothetical protein